MNLIILRALFEDARQQVLDNKVFRLLLILTAIPIAFTFMVGFEESTLSFFWGWKEVSYQEFISSFGGGTQSSIEDLSEEFIQGVQSLILFIFVGNIGMMLCIAATAFFAPRILEKGSADTLFSKPVSRMAILMSRYVAGILFVSFISALLVVGMYLGFWVNSGYNDPGFLWGALTLVYLYAMMHAFSIAVAVYTRSSVAAILLTITLFMISGAVHSGWIGIEYRQQKEQVSLLRAGGEEEDSEEEEESSLVSGLLTALRVAHYTLPKTTDADVITQKLRRALTEKTPIIETDDGDFVMKLAPAGLELVEGTLENFESTGIQWSAPTGEDAGAEVVKLRRYPRPEFEKVVGGKTRIRSVWSRDIAKDRVADLKEKGADVDSDKIEVGGVSATRITWTMDGDSRQRRLYVLHFDKWMYELEIEGDQSTLEGSDGRQMRQDWLGGGNMVFGKIAGMGAGAWYQDAFDWGSEMKYNVFFSIGSSLAFIFAMLGLAWLKLRRIDF